MLRRRTMTKSFLIGVHELEKQIGAEATEEWMRRIGEKLAETEGSGLMGEEVNGLYCFKMCLFAPKLDEFIEDMGLPKGHKEIMEYVKARETGVEGPAAVNVCCPMCYAYRRRRGTLAGKKDLLHLGAKYKLTGEKVLNKEAIKKSGHSVEEIEKLLEKYDCVNMYV